MKKTRFLKLCETALDHARLKIVVCRADRENYPCVFLLGAWGRDSDNVHSTNYILFTPQWRKDHFMTWCDTCANRAVKFRRWLTEFQGEEE